MTSETSKVELWYIALLIVGGCNSDGWSEKGKKKEKLGAYMAQILGKVLPTSSEEYEREESGRWGQSDGALLALEEFWDPSVFVLSKHGIKETLKVLFPHIWGSFKINW